MFSFREKLRPFKDLLPLISTRWLRAIKTNPENETVQPVQFKVTEIIVFSPNFWMRKETEPLAAFFFSPAGQPGQSVPRATCARKFHYNNKEKELKYCAISASL